MKTIFYLSKMNNYDELSFVEFLEFVCRMSMEIFKFPPKPKNVPKHEIPRISKAEPVLQFLTLLHEHMKMKEC